MFSKKAIYNLHFKHLEICDEMAILIQNVYCTKLSMAAKIANDSIIEN